MESTVEWAQLKLRFINRRADKWAPTKTANPVPTQTAISSHGIVTITGRCFSCPKSARVAARDLANNHRSDRKDPNNRGARQKDASPLTGPKRPELNAYVFGTSQRGAAVQDASATQRDGYRRLGRVGTEWCGARVCRAGCTGFGEAIRGLFSPRGTGRTAAGRSLPCAGSL